MQNEICRVCFTCWKGEKCVQGCGGRTEERGLLEDVGVQGSIILN